MPDGAEAAMSASELQQVIVQAADTLERAAVLIETMANEVAAEQRENDLLKANLDNLIGRYDESRDENERLRAELRLVLRPEAAEASIARAARGGDAT